MEKVSCIIAAYNEGPRIEKVLAAAYQHPLISEIIVVDDGSEDDTQNVVKKFPGITLIVHEKNKGKSKTVLTGIAHSTGEKILLLDADLIGLTPRDISDLIEPVISGRADISISLRQNAPWIWRAIGIDFISGERVFSRALIQNNFEEIKRLPRFGLESYLNTLVIKNTCRIKIVFWKNVISPWKYKKAGLFSGIKGDFLMIVDVFRTISVFEAIYQIIKMSLLKV